MTTEHGLTREQQQRLATALDALRECRTPIREMLGEFYGLHGDAERRVFDWLTVAMSRLIREPMEGWE